MGYVVASNPFGQMIFSPLFGLWGNRTKSVRLPLLFSIAIFAVASGIYSSLEMFPGVHVKYWMLLSRFLVGVGSGKILILQIYFLLNTIIYVQIVYSQHHPLSFLLVGRHTAGGTHPCSVDGFPGPGAWLHSGSSLAGVRHSIW